MRMYEYVRGHFGSRIEGRFAEHGVFLFGIRSLSGRVHCGLFAAVLLHIGTSKSRFKFVGRVVSPLQVLRR